MKSKLIWTIFSLNDGSNTSNMKSGYSVIPAGCSPASINFWQRFLTRQDLPVHVALHPHLVREVPHQHPHHPQTSNSPADPEQSIAFKVV